ncbi:carboxypeptidase regulatory-like domain-containing protein, partial [Thermus sp.]
MRKAFILALIALGAVLTACSRPPDFTISLNPTSLTVQQGSNGTTTLTVTPQNGFAGTVNLSLVGSDGNPVPGITLSPTSVNVTGSSPVTHNLTISVADTVDAGDYNLQIKATSGNLSKTASLNLKVTGPAGTENLSGMVVSENAGGPVAGSQVRLMRGNTLVAATTTDAQGAFTFANIPAGTYRLEVQKPGMAGSFVEGVRVPEMGFVRIIQKPAFDTAASTTPPTLIITQDGNNPLEGGTFTNTIPFRVQVDTTKDFVRPMRYIYVALGRTPGSAFLSNTATSSRRIFIEVEDTGSQTLSGTAVAGLGNASGEQVFLEVVAYDFNNNRSHYIVPLTFVNTSATQNNTVSAPTGVAATAITLTEAVGFYSAPTPLKLTAPFGKGQVGEVPLDLSGVPEGSNLYVEVRWCYTATAVPFAFDIERSEDGQNWTRVGTVGGARSASCPTNPFNRPFFYRDASPDLTPGQTYYYRVVARGANQAESNPSSTTPLP